MIRNLILLASVMFASAVSYGADPGREGLLFLCLRGDARSASLGSANTALTEGETALFGNPAGAVQRRQIAVSDTLLFYPAGFFGETLVGLWPAGRYGILGGGFFLLRHDDLPVTTEVQPEGTGSFAALFDVELALMGSQWLTEVWSAGMAVRVMHEQLGDLETKAAAVDIGLIRVISPEVTLGFAARSMGRMIRSKELADSLPFSLDAGIGFSPLNLPAKFYFGGQLRPTGLSSGGVAVEFGEWYGGLIRGGLNTREDGIIRYSAGVGVHVEMWHMDYSFAPVGDLGYMNRLTLSIRFGKGS